MEVPLFRACATQPKMDEHVPIPAVFSDERQSTVEQTLFSDPLSDPYFLSLDEFTALHDLAIRGSYRSILDKVIRSRNLSLHTPTLPHIQLTYTTYYIIALTKLRKYDDVLAELQSLHDFDSSHYLYESYPDLYPNKSGSFLPFSLRFIHAIIPLQLNQRLESLDRLYTLLDFVKSKVNLKAEQSLDSSVTIWKKRESSIVNSIIGIHLGTKEYEVCLKLINYLIIERNRPNDVSLLSKLGYVLMLIGDLEGAKSVFERVQRSKDGIDETMSETEFKNLVNRNKALLYMVAKDYVSAVREYDECIERYSGDVAAINNKSICLLYLMDLSDSIKVLEGALEQVPTQALNETLVVNLCSMYELAFVNHADNKSSLNKWIAQVAPDDFVSSATRT